MYHLGDWLVDPETRRVSSGSKITRLSPKAMQVLSVLHHAEGKVVSRGELLNEVWPDVTVGEEVLTHAIAEVRKAFGDNTRHPRYIETVHKSGYRLLFHHLSHSPTKNIPEKPIDGSSSAPTTYDAGPKPEPTEPFQANAELTCSRMPVEPDAASESDRASFHLSLIVLPFQSLSNDRDESYFADGMTETLTTDLSRISRAFVIASTTARLYGKKEIDPQRVLHELGVRYVLRGSVQKNGPFLRVNAMLIDSKSGQQLWSERFDGDISNTFALQDHITSRIANSLGRKISAAAIKDVAGASTARQVIDFLMHGIAVSDQPQSMENLQLQECYFRKAIALDPECSEALARLARAILLQEIPLQNSSSTQVNKDRVQEAADATQRALAIDLESASAHLAMSLVHQLRGDPTGIVFESERAIALDRNLALAHGNLASGYLWLGRPDDAFPAVENAIRLDPLSPQLGPFLSIKGRAYLFIGETADALASFASAQMANSSHVSASAGVAIANAIRGDLVAARHATKFLLTQMPTYRLSCSTFAPLALSSDLYQKLYDELVVPAATEAELPI